MYKENKSIFYDLKQKRKEIVTGGDCRVTDGDDCMIVCDRSVNKGIFNNNGMNK